MQSGVDRKGADTLQASNTEKGCALEVEAATHVLDYGNVLHNHLAALVELGCSAEQVDQVGANLKK